MEGLRARQIYLAPLAGRATVLLEGGQLCLSSNLTMVPSDRVVNLLY
jgi:hypothetical protein